MLHVFRRSSRLVVVLLFIEFLDELLFGVVEAAWPLIRADFNLSYAQIGLLLSVPGLVSALIEPGIGILGDLWRRRVLVAGGGLVYALAVVLAASTGSYAVLLVAFIVLYPASGAFVSLAQATLMDTAPQRHEHNMARWTFAGSIGVVAGPILLAVGVASGFGWRAVLLLWTLLALVAAWWIATGPAFPTNGNDEDEDGGLRQIWAALRSARQWSVWRWLLLLQFSDFLLDGLHSFLALYLVDVAGISAERVGWAVAVWTGVGLVGDFLLIPLLERVRGLTYLRYSVVVQLFLYPAFLLLPTVEGKLICLAFMGLFNAGWYAILQGQLYSALPGNSGTVVALTSLVGLAGSLLPLAIGLIAASYGLQVALWVLLLGPVVMLICLPRR